MRYYIYISRPKVDMLYPQVPQRFFKTFDTEVKLNLGILSTGAKGTTNQKSEELAAKVAVVRDYIQAEGEVGTLQNPAKYIAGTLPLQYGIVSEYASDIAFFGGEFLGKTLGLIGSSESLVGEAQRSTTSHAPFYYTLRFLNGKLNEREPGV